VERLETACCRLSTPFVVLALRQGEVCVARRGLPLFAWNAPEGVYYGSVAGEGSVAVPERIRVVVDKEKKTVGFRLAVFC
jgi:hypothetical protein